ncbi:WD40-repeat-containing domain protein [Fomes fomentarius]|nr:WD40-repeat-containing domain protein [Fomes fomentarius]
MYGRVENLLDSLVASNNGEWVASSTAQAIVFWNVDLEIKWGTFSSPQPSDAYCLGRRDFGSAFCSPNFRFFVGIGGMNYPLLAVDYKKKAHFIPRGSIHTDIFCPFPWPSRNKIWRWLDFVCYSSSKIVFILEDGVLGIVDLQESTTPITLPRPLCTEGEKLRPDAFAVSVNEHWLADWHKPGTILAEELLAATFNHSNASLVAISDHGAIWSWDVASGIPLHRPVPLCGAIPFTSEYRMRFSRVGMRLGILPVFEHTAHDGIIHSPKPDSHSERDSSMVVVDLSSPTGPHTPIQLHGHKGRINVFSFSPDGRFVATASADYTVRLWRTSDGTCVETYTEHEAPVTHVVFSGNGDVLASGAEDGTVRVRKKMQEVLSCHSEATVADAVWRSDTRTVAEDGPDSPETAEDA